MRVTSEHWSAFLDMAEKNPVIITNKFNGIQGKMQGNAVWQNVADKLNSLGYGQKSVTEWRKTFTDWKSKVKTKAAKIRSAQTATGGGTVNYVPLTPLEEKLLNIMGRKALEGDSGVRELGQLNNLQVDWNMNIQDNVIIEDVGIPACIEDHTYQFNLAEKEISTSTVTSAKTNSNPPAKKRRTFNSVTGVSENLQEMSRESIDILKRIDRNIERLADSFVELTEILKNKRSFSM